MAKIFLPNECVLEDGRFLQLVLRPGEFSLDEPVEVFDVNRAVNILRSNPGLAAALLSQTRPGRTVYWTGERREATVGGRSFGVRLVNRKDSVEVVGENRFGIFLSSVREALVKSLDEDPLPEQSVRAGQVISDFTRKDAYRSDIEERELAGERFVHVDHYSPARFRFDASLDGTTGHASRLPGGEGAPWQRFECPFGVSYPSPIIVETEAEASFLFERALRGEVDWIALLRNLRDRNLFRKGISEKQIAAMAQEYRSQFEWMREQIATDTKLHQLPVVASSLLVKDSSMGRSVFDPVYAPSPAHILARYINNPLLLFTQADYSVVSSLEMRDRQESGRLGGDALQQEGITLVVFGSDTIGGREPGRKATSSTQKVERKDKDGRKIITTTKKWEMPFKSKADIEKDYEVFKSRMDSILSGIAPGTKVTLVTGNSFMSSSSVGVGLPRLVSRYVEEKQKSGGDFVFDVLAVDHFADMLPVISGSTNRVSFLLDPADPESEVTRDWSSVSKGPHPSAAVCFSVAEDQNFNNILSEASLFITEGIPVIHVQENRSEEEQAEELRSGAVLSRSAISGDIFEKGTLFEGTAKVNWDIPELNNLSYYDSENGIAVPFVSNLYASPVSVGGARLRSALGVYAALAAQACGEASRDTLSEIAASDGRTEALLGIISRFSLDEEQQENCLRRCVRLMCSCNEPFYRRLMDLDSNEIVMPVSVNEPTYLFTDLSGNGLNRFGMVLTEERARMVELSEARRRSEEDERRRSIEEASRRQKIAVSAKAEGQLIPTGLPARLADSTDAVWFIGTNTPDQLALQGQLHSFEMWDDMNGSDPLVREKARREWVDDGNGGRIDNDFVFLFPSDLAAVTGRRRPNVNPDSRDLTGVTRRDPRTGEEFACAFGIPVRMNNRGNEINNDDNLPCSYRLDNDASNFAQSLVLADSLARSTAFRHGLTLCLPGRCRQDNTPYFTLGQVFMQNIYDRREKKWVPNPHASHLNEMLTERYIKLLDAGKGYPLNCIPLPLLEYKEEDYSAGELEGKMHVSSEGRFLSDLMLSLRIANSMALALGVPLRFPLDAEGRIDLGPGVPEHLRALAQNKIESFIGVVHESDLQEQQPYSLQRIGAMEAAQVRSSMVKSGTDVYLRPNDLVEAFGRFDFSFILSGQTAPLHEMFFRLDDGTVVSIVDAKLNRGLSVGELNEYLRYEKNDERRFIIRSTDPEKIPQFISTLKASIALAKTVRVETRLVSESELKIGPDGLPTHEVEGLDGQSLGGFVKLLSSNDDQFAEDEHTIGRERTIFNGSNRFDNFDAEQVYWGKEDARDGFKGYAQYRFVYADGTAGHWSTINYLDLAKDVVMATVHRKYKSDEYSVPPMRILELFVKGHYLSMPGYPSEVLKHGGMDVEQPKVDSKIVVLEPTSNDVGSVSPIDRIDGEAENNKESKVEGTKARPSICWSVSDGGYAVRTRENANADGVDFTLAFAIDFDTYGERCTARAAGDSLIAVDLPVRKNGGLDLSAKAVKTAVDQICEALPEEFLSGEEMGLNIAGNGLSTLSARGITQQQCDEFLTKVLSALEKRGASVSLVRCGGQTGIDEAGVCAALANGISAQVHVPKGWQFRGADGVDISDEKAFRSRFDAKDYEQLAQVVKNKATVGSSQKL